jgi:hypothetical protein
MHPANEPHLGVAYELLTSGELLSPSLLGTQAKLIRWRHARRNSRTSVRRGQCQRIRLRHLLWPATTCISPTQGRRLSKSLLLPNPPTRTLRLLRFNGICRENKEPTSGLEPLTCSLRVIHQALQGYAGDCKCRIFRGVSFPCLAECCTVLRSRWYQSGIKRPGAIGRFWLNRTEALQDRGYENPITPFYAFG